MGMQLPTRCRGVTNCSWPTAVGASHKACRHPRGALCQFYEFSSHYIETLAKCKEESLHYPRYVHIMIQISSKLFYSLAKQIQVYVHVLGMTNVLRFWTLAWFPIRFVICMQPILPIFKLCFPIRKQDFITKDLQISSNFWDSLGKQIQVEVHVHALRMINILGTCTFF